MDHIEVGKLWNQNAENWTTLSRMGCDNYRNRINSPAFFSVLPPLDGKRGLDIGCGEGYNTRLLSEAGAQMTGIDIASVFINHAREFEQNNPARIDYLEASAVELPYENESFDFATAFMSLMDAPDHNKILSEAYRVVRPGGFFQFSISHPCFATPQWNWILDDEGKRKALVCGDYFKPLTGEIEEWIFSATPDDLKEKLPRFKIPRFTRTLSSWLNLILATGFTLERFVEPTADDETIAEFPALADSRIIAYFLIIQCRKGY